MLQELFTRLNVALGRVERGQDHGLGLRVLQYAILIRVEHRIHESVTLIFLITRDRVPVIALAVIVGVLTLNVVLLRLSEELDGVLGVDHPRVRQDLASCEPFGGVFLQETREDVSCLLRDAVLELVVRSDDHFLQLIHIVGTEGHDSVEHGVKHDTARPYVNPESFIASILENLRRNIGRCATLLCHDLAPANDLADTEVTDLDFTGV